MISALNEAFHYELKSIKDSWYKLFLISIFPLLSFILIIAIFRSGVVHELPIAVVDNDKSELSRMVITNIEASSTMKIAYMPNSVKEAVDLVKSTKAYAVIVIPSHFSKDTLLQKYPSITVMLNTQYILVGKILMSALTSSLLQSSGEIEYVKNLLDMQNPDAALHSISPIGIQVTPFFNTYQNYFYFLVSALLPAIWQICIVLAAIASIGSIFKYKKEKEIFKDSKHTGARLVGLMLPYTIAFMVLGIGFLLYIYSIWQFQGSFTIMIFGMFLTVVAYQFIALFFFIFTFNYELTLSAASVYTSPAFAFLGITFPIYNMNEFALFWRDILPISHYMELQISQANYAANIFLETDKLWALFAFWLLFIPVVFVFRIKMKKELK
jgi:ABC-2 type transport system permease protein